MKRTVCVVTGSRAEYGLVRWIIEEIDRSDELDLQLTVTGMHLAPEFGSTYREIEEDGFRIDWKVEMLLSGDTPSALAASMGLGMIGFGTALRELDPDLLLVVGDRFEVFAAVSAALVSRIPVAHLHGGETSEGAFDEAIRHSITKMSHLHFVAADEYRRRVIQLGEHPDRVFTVGGLGVDAIRRLPLLDRRALEESLDFSLGERSLLVTFHPATLEGDAPERQLDELLEALDDLEDTRLIFTLPNADTGGRRLGAAVAEFVATRSNARLYSSLGQLRYLSALQYVDGVIGNSSSGLTEVPSFRKGTVNIGSRQEGRLKARSVIDCKPERTTIAAALDHLFSKEFQSSLDQVENPYGDGGATERVVEVLTRVPLDGILSKSFYDHRIQEKA